MPEHDPTRTDRLAAYQRARAAEQVSRDEAMRVVELYGLSQHGNRGRFVPWRAEDAWPCQLHGAITQAIHDAVAQYKRSCRSGVRHADQLLNIGLAANDALPIIRLPCRYAGTLSRNHIARLRAP